MSDPGAEPKILNGPTEAEKKEAADTVTMTRDELEAKLAEARKQEHDRCFADARRKYQERERDLKAQWQAERAQLVINVTAEAKRQLTPALVAEARRQLTQTPQRPQLPTVLRPQPRKD